MLRLRRLNEKWVSWELFREADTNWCSTSSMSECSERWRVTFCRSCWPSGVMLDAMGRMVASRCS